MTSIKEDKVVNNLSHSFSKMKVKDQKQEVVSPTQLLDQFGVEDNNLDPIQDSAHASAKESSSAEFERIKSEYQKKQQEEWDQQYKAQSSQHQDQ